MVLKIFKKKEKKLTKHQQFLIDEFNAGKVLEVPIKEETKDGK